MTSLGNALNNVIAVVVVILILSLIVQSIQGAVKKALKLKSRQLENSILDLFETAFNEPSSGPGTWFARLMSSSPILKAIYGFIRRPPKTSSGSTTAASASAPAATDSAAPAPSRAEELTTAVMTTFTEIGRVAQTGKCMLDSLSKADLRRTLEKLTPARLLDDASTGGKINFVEIIGSARAEFMALKTAIDAIDPNALIGDASANFAAFQKRLVPLFNDIEGLFNGTKSLADLRIEDLLSLRRINLDEVLRLLGEVQKKIDAADGNSSQTGAALRSISGKIASLDQKLDLAMITVRSRLDKIDNWYDTVMQSFEERYTRGMKTWALVISFAVVVLLNANFFNIYKAISTSEAVRDQIVQKGEQLKGYKDLEAKAQVENKPQEAETLQKLIADTNKEISDNTAVLAGFGFTPLQWSQVVDKSKSLTTFDGQWWPARKQDISVLLGWAIMTLLLSVGAPFWQDTLESLFGIKSLIRKKGDIKNVEQEPGAGQPKP